MPNLQNAKKALRQAKKRTERNKLVKAELKSLQVKFRKAITAKEGGKAQELISLLTKKIDKAAGKGMLKKNTASRQKSRMAKKANALKALATK